MRILKKIKKATPFLLTVMLFALTLMGCSNHNPYGPYVPPWGPGRPWHPQGQFDSLFLSSDQSISIRDSEVYGRFLEEVMMLCRNNRNTGFIWEWHHGGSFGSPTSSCDWATQNYTEFAIDLYLDRDAQHNSRVDIVFWVGARSSGYLHHQANVSWLPSVEVTGELRYMENESVRVVYRPDFAKPSIVIRFNGTIDDLFHNQRGTIRANIKYEDSLGEGNFSIVEEEYYPYNQYSNGYNQYNNRNNQYNNGYNQYNNRNNQYNNGYNQYNNRNNQYSNGYNQYNNGYNQYNNGYNQYNNRR